MLERGDETVKAIADILVKHEREIEELKARLEALEQKEKQ
jgi:hypothetical protein